MRNLLRIENEGNSGRAPSVTEDNRLKGELEEAQELLDKEEAS